MTLLEELRQVAVEQNQDAELPDSLLSEILTLVERPGVLAYEAELKKLIGQLRNFDLYAGAGCFSESCGIREITETIQQIAP
ncbi:MAG: hypothetical protein LWW87_14365 [Geobacteraceae bacterium]|nr:hypothetical protein [Geobacteraceae bacterium]